MKPILAIFACCLLFTGYSCSRQKSDPDKNTASFSRDTSIANHYIDVAGTFAVQKETLDSAYIYMKKLFGLSQKQKYARGLAEYYRLRSVAFNTLHQYDSSGVALQKELYWAGKSPDPLQMANVFASKAIRFQEMSELDSAAKYYIRSLPIFGAHGHKKNTGIINANLSMLFDNIGDHKSAEKYARAGYKISKEIDDSLTFLTCLLNLGSVKYNIQNYDSALVYFEQLRNMVKYSPQYQYFATEAMLNEGNILSDRGQDKKSIEKYTQLLQKKTDISPYDRRYIYANMAASFQKLKQLEKAEININKAIQFDKQIKKRQELQKDYELLSEIKQSQHQFEAALDYLIKSDSLKDTLMNATTKKNMHLLQVKYRTAQKDKQIAQQKLVLAQKQHSIQRKKMWMFIFIGGFGALGVILILSYRSYGHKQKLHHQNVLTLKKQHEVETLKTRIDAREEERNRISAEMHDDIGSALTTIMYLCSNLTGNNKKESQRTIDKITRAAGSVVDKMNEIIWLMNKEHDTLEDLLTYIRRNAVEFLSNHGKHYEFVLPDELPEVHMGGEARRSIYLVVKEALHNVIKHAEASQVSLHIQIDEELYFTIHDNGKGIDMNHLRKFGNGLRNMKQRMESVGGSFEIEADEGTTIILHCPLEQKEMTIA